MNNMPNPNLAQMQNMQYQRMPHQMQPTNNMQPDFSQQFNNFMQPHNNNMQGIQNGGSPIDSFLSNSNLGTIDTANHRYISALLERYISKIVKVEFLVGDMLNDRVGRLLSVGEDYIVLGMLESKVIVICNTQDLKFATVILDEENADIEF